MCTTTRLTSSNSESSMVDVHQKRPRLERRHSSLAEASWHIGIGSVISALVVAFSLYFPFVLAPSAASETYQFAYYDYDINTSHFDNTLATYGTDYFLALAMLTLILSISTSTPASASHAWRSRGLLACYGVSVLAGGLAHQFYTEFDQRRTWHFRLLWTICVGSVTAASGFMGVIGSELVREDVVRSVAALPLVEEGFWVAFGVATTTVCALGGLSFQRPACDIFIGGTTQFVSTFYMMAIFGMGLPTLKLQRSTRIMGVLGFILNAPLLPMYPLLVQYTDWSLGAVNTLLHTWLLVAWGLQGLALRQVERALAADAQPPPVAVPVKKRQ